MQDGRELLEIAKMTHPEQPDESKRKRGRPPKYAGEGVRQNFSFRITPKVRERLIAVVKQSGRSISEEIEFRLNRDLNWEDSKGDINQMLAEAAAARSAARVLGLRAAGFLIVREIGGRPSRVIFDIEKMLAEGDAIVSAFGPSEQPLPDTKTVRPWTTEEERRVSQELENILGTLAAKIVRTHVADAAEASKDDDEAA
jgi:hypothetical protein